MIELLTTSNHHVGIIGNLNIDLSIRNIPELPQWGHEVIGDDYRHTAAGQAANTGMALAKLGHTVTIIGNIGEDQYGQEILATLVNAGVPTGEIEITKNTRTGLTVAPIRPDGERAFISAPGCLTHFDENLVKRHISSLKDCGLVCMLGNFFIPGLPLSKIRRIFQILKSDGKQILLDTGWDTGSWRAETIRELREVLHLTDIFIPNQDEIKAITGKGDPIMAAGSLCCDGPKIVVAKLGPEGSFIYSDEIKQHVPALKVNALDTIGAGDVFNAGFIHGFLQGWPLLACLQFGNSLSSIYISRIEDRFPVLDEVNQAASTYRDYIFKSGVLS